MGSNFDSDGNRFSEINTINLLTDFVFNNKSIFFVV